MNDSINPVGHILKNLSEIGKKYPGIWHLIDKARAIKGHELEGSSIVDWPN
jgi:hypothetical protein